MAQKLSAALIVLHLQCSQIVNTPSLAYQLDEERMDQDSCGRSTRSADHTFLPLPLCRIGLSGDVQNCTLLDPWNLTVLLRRILTDALRPAKCGVADGDGYAICIPIRPAACTNQTRKRHRNEWEELLLIHVDASIGLHKSKMPNLGLLVSAGAARLSSVPGCPVMCKAVRNCTTPFSKVCKSNRRLAKRQPDIEK